MLEYPKYAILFDIPEPHQASFMERAMLQLAAERSMRRGFRRSYVPGDSEDDQQPFKFPHKALILRKESQINQRPKVHVLMENGKPCDKWVDLDEGGVIQEKRAQL